MGMGRGGNLRVCLDQAMMLFEWRALSQCGGGGGGPGIGGEAGGGERLE